MKKVHVIFLSLLFLAFLCPVSGEQNVKINEFAIDLSPQQVELINISSSSADISNWYLDDGGGTTYYSIPQNTYLYPNSCLVFSYDLNLNKSSPDTLRLLMQPSPQLLQTPPSSTPMRINQAPGPACHISEVPMGKIIG